MNTLQKAGGLAALFQALGYLLAFAVMGLTDPGNTTSWSADQKLTHLFAHPGVFHFWAIFYYAFGIALIIMAIALDERLKKSAPLLMKITTPFALIWTGFLIASGMISQVGLLTLHKLYASDINHAYTAWQVLTAVQDGLGGGVELVGGVWVLLFGTAMRHDSARSQGLFGLSLVVGLAGVLTIIPMLGVMKFVFGLSQILWFVWVGLWLLRPVKQT